METTCDDEPKAALRAEARRRAMPMSFAPGVRNDLPAFAAASRGIPTGHSRRWLQSAYMETPLGAGAPSPIETPNARTDGYRRTGRTEIGTQLLKERRQLTWWRPGSCPVKNLLHLNEAPVNGR